MSHHTAVLDGLAQLLHEKEMGVYNVDGVFTADQRGIVVSAFPETPASIISLAFYMPEYQRLNGRGRRLTATRIQIRTRIPGHPLETVAVFDGLSQLIDQKHLQLGAVAAHGEFISAAQPTQSTAQSWEQTSNWRFTALEGLPTP